MPKVNCATQQIALPGALAIFGATGDLSSKKLLPAVYDLFHNSLLSNGFVLIALNRDFSAQDFICHFRHCVKSFSRTGWSESVFLDLQKRVHHVSGDFSDPETYIELSEKLETTKEETGGNCVFYLSVPPNVFTPIMKNLSASGLSRGCLHKIAVEKPFGNDLKSAIQLNSVLRSAFPERAIFRVDHYLGKETIQNILTFRFGNQIFDPIWNRKHVDHVQITMSEDIGVEGRSKYYDGIGAARDVLQNHLLQLMALITMERPSNLNNASDIRHEKQRVLECVSLPKNIAQNAVRGQYSSGYLRDERVVSFLQEDGVNPSSRTETFAAIKLNADNERWYGVPFYVRTGKRMAKRSAYISLVFKPTDMSILQNVIVIRLQPDEGVSIWFASKVPGYRSDIRQVNFDFSYKSSFTESSPEAYERLILDAMRGEASLFPQQREVELCWGIIDPLEEVWENDNTPIPQYTPGSWGPDTSNDLLLRTSRHWRNY
ncbi:glucose-6-phosphate dehydrogenase [Tropheryma whipplei]|uniref:glucose-6-phosphate dehydrogenase n=1 Tax=Tropheryma whipplei TaxID=2039 RepID=UPI0004ACD457|nr:glucose-6-phosphate dehydrogenase [Tropheryma whipplei]